MKATWSRRTDGPLLLLMGGGLDSSALAFALRPRAGLVIDYGQAPAAGEIRAATAIGQELNLPVHTVQIDASAIGSGLLSSGAAGLAAAQSGTVADPASPSPEWWPYRNQLLVTIAAAFAHRQGFAEIVTGTVAPDAQRHIDGTRGFYDALDTLVSMQEGNMRVSAPAAHLSTTELLDASAVPASLLGWTHSCHISQYACGRCPGCFKAEAILSARSR